MRKKVDTTVVLCAVFGAILVQHWRIDTLINDAKAKLQSGNSAAGVRLLEKAEAIRPQNASTAFQICAAYAWDPGPEGGINACQRLVGRYPTQPLWSQLGQEYLGARDFTAAAAAFEHIAPGSNEAWYLEWYVYSLLLSGQYAKAVPACKEFRAVIANDPGSSFSPEAVDKLLAIAYDGSGDIEEAQRIYSKYQVRSCHVDVTDIGYSTPCDPVAGASPATKSSLAVRSSF